MEHLAWIDMLLHTKRSLVYLKYLVSVKTMRNVDGWWPADQLEYQDHLLNRDGRDVNFKPAIGQLQLILLSDCVT